MHTEWDVIAIGQRLRECRRKANLSSRQAMERAERLGGLISHAHILDMENGKIKNLSLSKLSLLARVYRVPLDDILSGNEGAQADYEAGSSLDGADVNLLAIRNISEEDYKAIVAEIARRRTFLEHMSTEETKRARRRKPTPPEPPER